MEFALAQDRREGLGERFGLKVAEPFGMTWRLWDATQPKRITVMVSRYDHCLLDLLWRWRRGELGAEIVMVISNHLDLREDVELFDVPYHHVPVEKDNKAAAEARQLELLDGCCEVVVLARYMQVLSDLRTWSCLMCPTTTCRSRRTTRRRRRPGNSSCSTAAVRWLCLPATCRFS